MPIRNNVIYILKYSLKHYVLLCKDILEKTSGAQSSSGTNINKDQLDILVQDL